MEQEEKGIRIERLLLTDANRSDKQLNKTLLFIIKFVLMLSSITGLVWGFTSAFGIPTDKWILLAGLFVLTGITALIFLFRKHMNWTLPLYLAVWALAVFLLHRPFMDGLRTVYTKLAEAVNQYYAVKLPLAAVENVSAFAGYFFIFFAAALLLLLLGAGVMTYLDAKLTALAITFPCAALLAVGKFPDLTSAVLILIPLICIFFLQHTRQRENYNGYVVPVQTGSSLIAKIRVQIGILGAILAGLILAVSAVTLAPVINEGYESQSQLREDIRNGQIVNDMRDFYKKLTRGEWDWLPFDIIRSSGVHGGKLSNIKEIRDYDELHLYLDISSDLYAPLYLRGYVGANYTGKGWKELTNEQEEASVRSGMTISELTDRYYNLLNDLAASGNSSVYGKLRLVITNMEANRNYSYIPYGSDLIDFAAGDAADTYTEEITDGNILNLYYMNTQSLKNIETLEKKGKGAVYDNAYEVFAKSVYEALPDEGLDRFYEEFGGLTFDSAADAVDFVRSTLFSRADYDKAAGSTPSGRDYVEYFLYENKKGACTHFASAAVLMFRTFGYPARYVEGYLTTELSAEGGPNAIMDSSAHAWAEIYLDGVGWIPIEVTPGFLNKEDMKDDRDKSDLSVDTGDDVEDTTAAEKEAESEETQEPEIETQAPTTEAKGEEPDKPSQSQTQKPTQPTTQPSSNNQTQNSDNGLWKQILKIVLIIVGCILLLALILYLIQLQAKIRSGKMVKKMKGRPREAILYTLTMLERFSTEKGTPIHEYSDLQTVLKAYPFLEEEDVRWLKEISLEAAFSNHAFDKTARDEVFACYKEFSGQMQERAGRLQKLVDRYIKCYYV